MFGLFGYVKQFQHELERPCVSVSVCVLVSSKNCIQQPYCNEVAYCVTHFVHVVAIYTINHEPKQKSLH